MKTEVISAQDPQAVRYAADVLRHDGLVAFPTDTVYGVGALVFHEAAVQRLYRVKGRSTDKAIAVLVAHHADLLNIAGALTASARQVAQKFWPGPLTLVVARHPRLPKAVSALPTVGVRQPDHPVVAQLLALTGPLAVTSANRSGEPNTLTAQEVLAQLEGRIDLILDGGRVNGGVPSTVVDVTGSEPVILRAGPVSAEDIEKALRSV
jgi:L-threonylcarbamoyladenylate synthase